MINARFRWSGDMRLGFVLRHTATAIAGVGRSAVADVIDAHLETVSMILLTTLWAVGYGWVEGTVGIGHLLAINPSVQWFGRFSTYHFVLGLTVFAVSFSFGFLKFSRMLYYRKRYMLFTALGNYPYALVAQDFTYFFFAPGDLEAQAWTCQGLSLGCWLLHNPWNMTIPFVIPQWYIVALSVSAGFFFLAYRSALVNLLVTRQVLKEIGFTEKTRIAISPSESSPTQPEPTESMPKSPSSPATETEPEHNVEPKPLQPSQQTIVKIVDSEREQLVLRLRERLERGG